MGYLSLYKTLAEHTADASNRQNPNISLITDVKKLIFTDKNNLGTTFNNVDIIETFEEMNNTPMPDDTITHTPTPIPDTTTTSSSTTSSSTTSTSTTPNPDGPTPGGLTKIVNIVYHTDTSTCIPSDVLDTISWSGPEGSMHYKNYDDDKYTEVIMTTTHTLVPHLKYPVKEVYGDDNLYYSIWTDNMNVNVGFKDYDHSETLNLTIVIMDEDDVTPAPDTTTSSSTTSTTTSKKPD